MNRYVDPVCLELMQLRLVRNLSRQELGNVIGVQGRMLWAWETGKHSPHLPLLRAWAQALEVELGLLDMPASFAARRAA